LIGASLSRRPLDLSRGGDGILDALKMRAEHQHDRSRRVAVVTACLMLGDAPLKAKPRGPDSGGAVRTSQNVLRSLGFQSASCETPSTPAP